jgi:hypothetical protein
MHLLIQIKNKVKLDDDNERLEQNNHGALENNSSKEGMYKISLLLGNMFSFSYPVV